MKALIVAVVYILLNVGSQAGMPKVDERLIGVWQIDTTHSSLDTLDEVGAKMFKAFFGEFKLELSDKSLIKMNMMGRNMTGYFQDTGDTSLFMLLDNGEYGMSNYQLKEDYMFFSFGKDDKTLPLKKISDNSPDLTETEENYERLDLPINELIGKDLIVREIILQSNEHKERLRIDQVVKLMPDNSRAVLFGDKIIVEDTWTYDPSTRTLFWGGKENGHFYHLVDYSPPMLTFQRGALGPNLVLEIESD